MKQLYKAREVEVGRQMTVFRLNSPKEVVTVAKVFKHFIELEDGSRWTPDGLPYKTNDQIDVFIRPWLPEHQEFLNSHIELWNSNARIARKVRVKRIFKESVLVDYGPNSNFEIKFNYDTLESIDQYGAWQGFQLRPEDVTKLKERYQQGEQE